MKQVIGGLLYLHSHNILHRDLTLANLLLTKEMKVVSAPRPPVPFIDLIAVITPFCFFFFEKIADFGLATKIEPGEDHTTMCGTPNYISPYVICFLLIQNFMWVTLLVFSSFGKMSVPLYFLLFINFNKTWSMCY